MKKHISKIALLITVVALVIAVYGCGGGGGGNGGGGMQGPATVSIPVVNNAAAPMGFSFNSPVAAHSGDSVSWHNQSTASHGITWDGWTPNTSPAPGANIAIFLARATSGTWTAPTVTTMTTYNYHCTVHGVTMAGVINVSP